MQLTLAQVCSHCHAIHSHTVLNYIWADGFSFTVANTTLLWICCVTAKYRLHYAEMLLPKKIITII